MDKLQQHLHVQNYVRQNGLESLSREPLFLKVKRHPRYQNLVHISYDQLESPKNHPVIRETRGLILDETRGWSVVAYPFNRFANYGESWADPVDWQSAKVQDKLDGSMMIMWWYDKRWNVSTKGSPDAAGNVDIHDITFEQLFWSTFTKLFGLPEGFASRHTFNPENTYVWELTGRLNRVVVDYQGETTLTLIGVRNNLTYQEYPVAEWIGSLPVVRHHDLTSFDAVFAAAQLLNPMEHEGYVVVDDQFSRVKIKSPKYVLIHHMKDGFGQRRILDLIRLGEESEVLAHFAEYRSLYDEIKQRADEFCDECDRQYQGIRHIEDQKEFALAAKKTLNMHAMMSFFHGQAKNTFDWLFLSKKGSSYRFNAQNIEEKLKLKPRELTSEE